MTHTCVGNLTIIGSDNGLSPGRRQSITWTNVGILSIGPPGTNLSEKLIDIHTFSFKKIHLKMSSGKWRPICLGLNVIRWISDGWFMYLQGSGYVYVPCSPRSSDIFTTNSLAYVPLLSRFISHIHRWLLLPRVRLVCLHDTERIPAILHGQSLLYD